MRQHRILISSLFAGFTLMTAACVKFSPEVKATFEPAHPGEHSNFEPRHVAFTPIHLPAAPPDAGAHEDRGALVMEGPPPGQPYGPPSATAPAAAPAAAPNAATAAGPSTPSPAGGTR